MIYETTVTTGVEIFIRPVIKTVQRKPLTSYYAMVRVTALDFEKAVGFGWSTEDEAKDQAHKWISDTFGVDIMAAS